MLLFMMLVTHPGTPIALGYFLVNWRLVASIYSVATNDAISAPNILVLSSKISLRVTYAELAIANMIEAEPCSKDLYLQGTRGP